MEFLLFLGMGIYLLIVVVYCIAVSTNIILPVASIAWAGLMFYSFVLIVNNEVICKLKKLQKS